MSDVLIRIKRAVLEGRYAFSEKARMEMEAGNPMDTLRITFCPSCGSRKIAKVERNWSGTWHGRSYTVPSLEFYECPACGERIYDPQAMRKIEKHRPASAAVRPSKRRAS